MKITRCPKCGRFLKFNYIEKIKETKNLITINYSREYICNIHGKIKNPKVTY